MSAGANKDAPLPVKLFEISDVILLSEKVQLLRRTCLPCCSGDLQQLNCVMV